MYHKSCNNLRINSSLRGNIWKVNAGNKIIHKIHCLMPNIKSSSLIQHLCSVLYYALESACWQIQLTSQNLPLLKGIEPTRNTKHRQIQPDEAISISNTSHFQHCIIWLVNFFTSPLKKGFLTNATRAANMFIGLPSIESRIQGQLLTRKLWQKSPGQAKEEMDGQPITAHA